MRLHRFFIEESLRNKKDIAIFDENIIHQWKDVFRLRAGDKVILLDNSGFEYLSEITELHKSKCEVKIIEQTVVENIPKRNVTLFAALIKKDNYEWILEKGTEVGVSHFVPIISDRSEKKNLNMERAQKIIKEASEQSGRGMMPTISEPDDLKTILNNESSIDTIEIGNEKSKPYFPNGLQMLAFDVGGELFDVSKIKSSAATKLNLPETDIGILIGPEGGWSEKELNLFKEKNIPIYSIGSQVLRAETAAIVIPALFLF